MAPPSKEQKFGSLPDAIRIRIQARRGRQTRSFIVFGHSFASVEDTIQEALAQQFGKQTDEEEDKEQDTEFKAKIRRKRK